MCDAQTYELGHKLRDYEARFRCGDATESWKTMASPVHCVSRGAPPFLILYAEEEHKSLQRQSQLLHEALQRNKIPSELVAVPGQNHCRMVLTLSRPDRTSGPAILRFIRERTTGGWSASGLARISANPQIDASEAARAPDQLTSGAR